LHEGFEIKGGMNAKKMRPKVNCWIFAIRSNNDGKNFDLHDKISH